MSPSELDTLSGVERELARYVHPTTAQTAVRQCAAEADLTELSGADDLLKLAGRLVTRGGSYALVARLLKVRALQLGAQLPLSARPREITLDDGRALAVAVAEVQALAEAIGLLSGPRAQLCEALRHIGENVLIHAGKGQVAARRSPEGVRVVVRDQGAGLPASVLTRLQSTTTDTSWGLGRAKALVDLFAVVSTPGGTHVFLEKHVRPKTPQLAT